MEYIALKDVCKINMGQSPDSSSYNERGKGIPFFQGNADFGERYPVTRVWCSKPIKVAHQGDILVSVRAPIGALNYAKEKCCIGRGLTALTPDKSKVIPEFIYWLLKSKNAELNRKGTGSTFKAISRKAVEEIRVPCIDLNKQYEYVTILEKTYTIIQKYKIELNYLDELISDRFVELFGDPVINPMNWEEHYLDEYINFLTSGSRGWAKYYTDKESELFITIKNVKNNHIVLNDIQYIDAPNNKEADRTKVRAGDLLISITADLGRTGVVDDKIAQKGAYINQHLSLIRLNKEKIDPLFVSYFLETDGGKCQFERKNQIGVKSGLNFNAIKSLKILVPPKNLQEKYLDFIKAVDKSKAAVQKALDETQLLFDSLMQKYFG